MVKPDVYSSQDAQVPHCVGRENHRGKNTKMKKKYKNEFQTRKMQENTINIH